MSVLNALSIWQWLVLAAVPLAIVALYFLKLRRQPVEVPSTYLWSRTIEDLHVNSLWQRLRRSLLLLLQLLLVALVALACLRPGWRGTELLGNRVIFLIDTSASMSATDVNPTRLEAAKQRVLGLINQMKSNDVAMVISFSDEATVDQPFTKIRSLLRQRVNRIQPTNRRSDLREALSAAAGLANPGRTSEDASDIQVADALPATLYIFSDGGFAAVPNFSLGNLTPVYVAMGTNQSENVAVTSFNVERNPEKPGQTQAFARLENHGSRDAVMDVALYLDDELLDASSTTISANGEAGVQFELNQLEEGRLKLELQHQDDLLLDNEAYAALGIPRRSRVLFVTPGNEALRVAMQTDQAARVADVSVVAPDNIQAGDYRDLAAAGAYDLVIYDRCVPPEMPQANTLFVGEVPPVEGWSRGESTPLPIVIDTDRAHPLTYLVEMGGVKLIYEGFQVNGPEGSSILFDADVGPLLVVGQRDGFEDVVLGFEIIGRDEQQELIPKTDWPGRRSFPVFVMNALRYLGGLRGALTAGGVQTGDPVTLRSHYPVDRMEVTAPTGQTAELFREGQNSFVYSATGAIGIYTVREGRDGELTQRFAVNLFDSRESDLTPRSEIQLGYETVTGRFGAQPTRRELWKVLVVLAAGILFVEWYIYNRRVYL